MNGKRLLLCALLFFSVQRSPASSLNAISFTCGDNGELMRLTEGQNTRHFLVSAQWKALEQIKDEKDREQTWRRITGAGAAGSSELIELSYKLPGPNRNRTAKDYARKELEELVDVAISEGVDPFFAMAVVILENPPVKSGWGSYRSYREDFGSPPIDGRALAAELKCFIPKNQAGEEEQKIMRISGPPSALAGFLREEGVARLSGLNSGKHSMRVCSKNAFLTHGEDLHLREMETGYCCTNIKVKKPVIGDNGNVLNIADHYGMYYLKKRVQDYIKTDGNLTFSLQRYNGIGCWGCTEKVNNSCLAGIHMADRPVYGAQSADLMINMLMTNPEVVDLVLAKQKENNMPVTSVFCLEKGAGVHTFDKNRFWDEQYRYLMGGSDGNYRTYLGRGKFTADTAEEKKRYREIELERRRICGKHYANPKPSGAAVNSGATPSKSAQ